MIWKPVLIVSLVLAVIYVSSCSNTAKQVESSATVDTSLIESKNINDLFLDSASIVSFLNSHAEFDSFDRSMFKYYHKRNYQYAWFNNNGLVERAGYLMNMLDNASDQGITDTTLSSPRLKALYDQISDPSYQFANSDSSNKELELLLTASFFRYAGMVWGGALSEKQVQDLAWNIKRKKLPYVALLDSLIQGNPNIFAQHQPVYRQYSLLANYLKKYRDVEGQGGFPLIEVSPKGYQLKDSSSKIPALRKWLYMSGDLQHPDTLREVYDTSLQNAVKKLQLRYGLKVTGSVDSKTIAEMNVSVSDRIRQIMINMERARWVPVEVKGDYIAVNIPEFRMHIFRNDSLIWNMKVVVGASATETNIFNGKLKYIAFSPYWNIPASILTKEIIPAARKNPNYINKKNMEVIRPGSNIPVNPSSIAWANYTGSNFPYMVRQKPGATNSLGWVKFLFPNSYSIYFHDTPARNLFVENDRAFSHGCIRLAEPERFADYLLRNDTSWTKDKIKKVMYGGKETYVTLSKPIPVFIAYFTAWVDRDGQLNLRDDIYGHDVKLEEVMFADSSKAD